jgi:hypothetical protein
MDKEYLYTDIKKKIVHSVKAAGSKLYRPSEKHQSISVGNVPVAKQSQSKMKYFEFFGYDFMVDSNNHLWLI